MGDASLVGGATPASFVGVLGTLCLGGVGALFVAAPFIDDPTFSLVTFGIGALLGLMCSLVR